MSDNTENLTLLIKAMVNEDVWARFNEMAIETSIPRNRLLHQILKQAVFEYENKYSQNQPS